MVRLLINIFLSLLLVCIFGQKLSAQTESANLSQAIKDAIQYISESSEEDIDFSELTYTLQNYYQNPIDINHSSPQQLSELHILNPLQINALFRHIEQTGLLLSIYELQAIEGIDENTLKLLLPFVTVKEKPENTQINGKSFVEGEHEWSVLYKRSMEDRLAYNIANPKQRYLGSPNYLQFRYTYNFNNQIQYGLAAVKDVGEPLFGNYMPQGFDYYSGFFSYSGKGVVKRWVVGDYQAQVGQGLCVWNSFALDRTAEVMNVARVASGIKASVRASPASKLRGLGLQLEKGKFGMIIATSYQNLDANPLNEYYPSFSSLKIQGYHRNLSELSKRSQLQSYLGLTEIYYQKSNLKIGIEATMTHFIKRVNIADSLTFLPKNQSQNIGLNYQWSYKNIYLFGETASNLEDMATINGILMAAAKNLDISIVYRNYGVNYSAPYGNAMGRNTINSNEKAIYWGISYKPNAQWKLNSYTDFCTFPTLKYRVDAPSHAVSQLLSATYIFNEHWKYNLRFRFQQDEINIPTDEKIAMVGKRELVNLRFQINHVINEKLDLETRFETTRFDLEFNKPTQGFLFYQDFNIKILKDKLRLNLRYALFDIEDYNNRIYTFEDDVPYSFSIPFAQNSGCRYYLNFDYKWTSKFFIAGRISRTNLWNQDFYGSGLNQQSVPHITDVHAYIRYRI